LLGLLMLLGGAAWISFSSLFNVQVLNQAPDWVRARVLAVSMLVFQGAVAAGSAAWGSAAQKIGIGNALLWAGAGTIATTALGLLLPLPEAGVDLSPGNHWPLPLAIPAELEDAGPVLVTVEYYVDAAGLDEFMRTIREYGRVRRRDGASRWGICRDLETPDRYVETFVVGSWAEHIRQHDRMTREDSRLEDRLRKCIRQEPRVRHLVFL
jgi:hypothetical protein